jgi:pimeloyl-ACP methyl ester carboxylesterase
VEFKDADIQLVNMIKEIRSTLSYEGIELEEKITIIGYSCNGIFASRFAILQPEHVKCVVAGGHGWSILPLERYNGIILNYPFGIADVGEGKYIDRTLKLDQFYTLPMFYYIGSEDDNCFSYNAEEFEGIHCIGAPVLDYTNRPVAAIWISGASVVIPAEKFDEYGAILREESFRISERLGYLKD